MTAMPKKGDTVRWNTPQGETRGTVEAIVTKTATVKGHTAKATKDKPEVAVKSAKTGKKAIHKASALHKA
jgi:hypothetical protein